MIIKSIDSITSQDEKYQIFMAHVSFEAGQHVLLEEKLEGMIRDAESKDCFSCEIFFRSIAGDEDHVLATLRFTVEGSSKPLIADSLLGMEISIFSNPVES